MKIRNRRQFSVYYYKIILMLKDKAERENFEIFISKLFVIVIRWRMGK